MADTFRLRYGFPTLPTLANRNAESGLGNWASVGNHTISQSNTVAHGGTYSFKIISSDAGDATSNHAKLPSANNHTFVAGKQYEISIWAYTADIDGVAIQVKTGGVTFALQTVTTASTWTILTFKSAALTGATDFLLWASDAKTFYIDDIVVSEYVELTVVAERGMSNPDSFELFPAIQNRYLDGTMGDQIKAYRRKIWVDCGPVHSSTDQRGIVYWMIDNARSVDYLTEVNIPLCLGDVAGYDNEWKFDCSLIRSYSFALLEPSVRTGAFPV